MKAQSLRMWWRRDAGMLGFAGGAPGSRGRPFEAVINRMVDRMRPAKGEAWDTREHRGADVVELCTHYEDEDAAVAGTAKPLLVVQVPRGRSGGDRRDPVTRRDGRVVTRERGSSRCSSTGVSASPPAADYGVVGEDHPGGRVA